jgi:DNA-binding response OmpR family regulator
MAQVVLVAKEWNTRALLRAQLLEEGVEVEAYESLEEAFQSLLPSLPALFLIDLTASNDPDGDLHNLASKVTRVPTWIIASRSSLVGTDLEERGFDRVFFRPVDVGELVGLIKQRLQ